MFTTKRDVNSKGGAITLQSCRVYPHKRTQTTFIRLHKIKTTVIQTRTCRRRALCGVYVISRASKNVIHLSPRTVQTLLIAGWPHMISVIRNFTSIARFVSLALSQV